MESQYLPSVGDGNESKLRTITGSSNGLESEDKDDEAVAIHGLGAWRYFVGEESRGKVGRPDTRALSIRYHALSRAELDELDAKARQTTQEKQLGGANDKCTSRAHERGVKRMRFDGLVESLAAPNVANQLAPFPLH